MSTSDKPLKHRVFFTANAVALGAELVKPKSEFLNSVASSCVPAGGGRAQAHAQRHSQSIFSFESASTSAEGAFILPQQAAQAELRDYDDMLPATTSVKVELKGFSIDTPKDPAKKDTFERHLKIEHLEAAMQSVREPGGAHKCKSIQVAIDGVSVDGRILLVDIDLGFLRTHDTWERLESESKAGADTSRNPTQVLYRGNGLVLVTVVTGLRWKNGAPEQTQIEGNRLTIGNLGSIYFGEILVEGDLRRITLVRARLGCVHTGSSTAAEASSKINWVPPH